MRSFLGLFVFRSFDSFLLQGEFLILNGNLSASFERFKQVHIAYIWLTNTCLAARVLKLFISVW